jgi:hypothetical protein
MSILLYRTKLNIQHDYARPQGRQQMSNDSREVEVTFDEIVETCNKSFGSLDFSCTGLVYLSKENLLTLVNAFAFVPQSHASALDEIAKIRRTVEDLELELKAAQSRHAAEREALVRKCAEICHEYGQLNFKSGLYDCGRVDTANELKTRILALLDSGSQG